MSRVLLRISIIMGLGALLFSLSACGDDDDSGPLAADACASDADCEGASGGPACAPNGLCVECTDSDLHCEDFEECTENNQCVTPEVDCEEDSDCPLASQGCEDGVCTWASRQCGSVGEECDPDGRVRSGFACEDLGGGHQCYRTCYEYRVCSNGNPATQVDCDPGSICRSDDLDTPVCQPSQCDDFWDHESCEDIAAENPEEFADGTHCVGEAPGTFICQGAGTQQENEHCEATSDCAEGLACISELPGYASGTLPVEGSVGSEGYCAPACDSDDMCDGTDQCIGADSGAFDGTGVCADRCEPFGFENSCDGGEACVPVSSEDGMCFRFTNESSDYYQSCDTVGDCPDSSACLDLFGTGSVCTPLCDPTLPTDEQSSTCPQPDGEDRLLGGDCLDLNQTSLADGGGSRIGTGVCIEACLESEDWAKDGCSEDGYGCVPSGENAGWCESVGSAELGEECTGEGTCSSGLHCDMTGDGTGTCRAYCQTDEQTEPSLACADDEICVPLDDFDDLGTCRLPCDPGNNATDPECPENQQTCLGFGDDAYCASSGSVKLGDDCGSPTVQNCAPGTVCAKQGSSLNDVIAGPFSDTDLGETARCRSLCEPFLGDLADSGCPSGESCSPVIPDGPSRTQGHCVPSIDSTLSSLSACPESAVGSMCDENSYCIVDGGGSDSCGPAQTICLQLCDFATGTGCTGNTTCEEGFQGGPLLGFLGLCR